VVGVVMPVLAQLLYPVYMHQMQPEWAEWTRLFELPFVACELVIIHIAIRAGHRDKEIWRKLPKDVMVALTFLLVGLIVSSAFMSRNPAASVTLSITTIVHLRFSAAVFSLTRPLPLAKVKNLLQWLSAGLIVLAIITILKFSFPPPQASVPGGRIEWSSALPGFISVRHFGSWTGAIAAGMMIALLYNPSSSNSSRLLYLLAASMTFWSGTRAAVLSMAVVALIVAISLRRLPTARPALQVGVLSALAMLVAFILYPGVSDFALFIKDESLSPDTLASGRLELWHNAMMRWTDSPIFGWGSGSTFWEVNTGWAHTQPHNFVIQFLISWGIVGSVGGIWTLIRGLVAIHRIGVQTEELRPVIAILYAMLFMAMFEGMLYYPRFIMLIGICFAVLLSGRDQLRNVRVHLG
jgi:exopolysaccharide production protein ExoQ